MAEVFNLDNVEIFETGTWHGDEYTTKDLDDMVSAFADTRDALKPHVKLGHSNNQSLLQKDGYPSAGWITGLKRQGEKLLARIENVPEKIYNLINSKAYGRISSEIYWNLKLNGQKHRRALKAIALLGADTPEVHSLDDFISLYTENFNGQLKIYDDKDEETNMSDDRIEKLESELKEYSTKVSELENQYSDVLKENEELKKYAAKVEYDRELSEIKTYFDTQLNDGKITPSQYDYFIALSINDKEVKTYTNDKSNKIEGTSFELVKAIIENGSKQVDFSEDSKHEKVEKKSELSDDEKLFEKINNYMKEHKVSYQDAFDVISMEV